MKDSKRNYVGVFFLHSVVASKQFPFSVDAVYQYSKLQIDTERRVQRLANEMWIQQSEISRNQENSMQDGLSALIKQNRNLQEENEHLLKRNEKLSVKIGSFAYLTPRTNLGNCNLIHFVQFFLKKACFRW